MMGEGGTEESSSSVVRCAVLDVVLPPLRVLRTECFRRGVRCLRTRVPLRVSMDMTAALNGYPSRVSYPSHCILSQTACFVFFSEE